MYVLLLMENIWSQVEKIKILKYGAYKIQKIK
jgi:hypothetical protein